ncbi:MAG: hypothetical protein KC800_28390 [Candidatus Eremiobacteraeota bacterium]|nr:hypothetical protein [Candidatus Eremiobacteraeota bacterium]
MKPESQSGKFLNPTLLQEPSTALSLKKARQMLEQFSLSDFLHDLLGPSAGVVLQETYRYLHLGMLIPPGMTPALFRRLLAEIDYDDHVAIFQSEVMTLELCELTGRQSVPTTIYKAFRKPDPNGVRGIELFAPEAEAETVRNWIAQGVGAHLGIGLRSRGAVNRVTDLCASVGFKPPPFLKGRPALNTAEEILVFYLDGLVDSQALRLEFYHSLSECERARGQGLLP